MRHLLFTVSLLCVSLSASCIHAEPLDRPALQDALAAVLDTHPASQRATVYLKVVDLTTGEVLFDRGGDRLLTPASNLKIYTSACALDTFGPDHRFVTRVSLSEPVFKGRSNGQLVITGGGDAMLSSEDLRGIAGRVAKEWGLKRFGGRVVVDNSRYASPLKGPGWMWDDDPDYYNMSVTPMMVDFNVLTVRVSRSSSGKSEVELVPPSRYPPIEISRTDPKGGETTVTRKPFTDTILVSLGKIPAEGLEEELTMQRPGPWVAGVFENMLKENGVAVRGAGRGAEAPAPDRSPQRGQEVLVLEHEGVDLAATLRHFLHVSENAVGEVLLHEIAIAKGRDRPTWSDGAKEITDWLVNVAGLDEGSFKLVDGSGLSRYNLISADSSTRLIAFMSHHRYGNCFFKSLNEYEVPLEGIIWPSGFDRSDNKLVSAKTGGMTGVSTISGRARTLDGRPLAFSLLVNGSLGPTGTTKDLRQSVWRVLVQYRP